MFPALKVSVVGLDPSLKYIIMMDVVPADTYRYKYHESEWLVTGKAYPDVPKSKRVHCHSESPSSGAKWMSSVTSFHKVKITNNAAASKPGQVYFQIFCAMYSKFDEFLYFPNPHTC